MKRGSDCLIDLYREEDELKEILRKHQLRIADQIFLSYVAPIPCEIWIEILNWVSQSICLRDLISLKSLSKVANEALFRIRYLRIDSLSWGLRGMLPLFGQLEVLCLYDVTFIDLSSFGRLRELYIYNIGCPVWNLRNIASLNNLQKLYFQCKGSLDFPSAFYTEMSQEQKERVSCLIIINGNSYTPVFVQQFPNLERLVLSGCSKNTPPLDVSSMRKLTYFECESEIIKTSNYTGYGKSTTDSKGSYLGNFVDGLFEGKGIYFYPNGRDTYEVEFKKGNLIGRMKPLFSNDSMKPMITFGRIV